MNADNNSTIAAAKATIARVAVTTTSIISTVISETTAPAPTAAPSNIPNTASATVSQDPPPVGGSKYYSAICIVCGVGFVSAVLFYIYATRNKSYNTNDNTIMKRTMNQSGGNSGKFDIRVDKPSKSPSGKGSTFNMSGDNSFAYSSFQQSENLSPYSEQNTFVNNSNPMAMGYNGNQDQKKLHYPNPLYEHSRPINRNTSVIRATESDITDEDVNLNILTQEEIQLLKMRQKNMRNGNNINNINNINNNAINKNNQMFNSKSAESNSMNYGKYPNSNMNMNMNRNMNSMAQSQVSNPKINPISPDSAVAPFNYMNNGITSPNEIFRRVSDESSSSSYYNDNFIRNLGSDIKIETKKVEYVQAEENPINKLKIKRMNN